LNLQPHYQNEGLISLLFIKEKSSQMVFHLHRQKRRQESGKREIPSKHMRQKPFFIQKILFTSLFTRSPLTCIGGCYECSGKIFSVSHQEALDCSVRNGKLTVME
jgi:hypothetical protein